MKEKKNKDIRHNSYNYMNYLLIYKSYLPFVMLPSITTSYLISLDELTSKSKPQTRMMNTLGILSLGTFVGLSYPISIPLLTGRYLYLNRIV